MSDLHTQDAAAASAIADLAAVVRLLRAECPWDREQTIQTIVPYTLEEAWEVACAAQELAEGDDPEHLVDELGDLLFQVCFLSLLVEEDHADLSLAAVAHGIREKLIRRHPHVFGNEVAEDADAVRDTWEKVKQQEAAVGEDAASQPEQAGTSSRVKLWSEAEELMPATLRARKVQRRASRLGFDFTAALLAMPKLTEECDELEEAIRNALEHGVEVGSESAPPEQRLVDEAGDVLFAAVNVLRLLRVDPELALHAASKRFAGRVEGAAELAQGDGNDFSQLTLGEQERYYQQAKTTKR